jgi:hypothetical protein
MATWPCIQNKVFLAKCQRKIKQLALNGLRGTKNENLVSLAALFNYKCVTVWCTINVKCSGGQVSETGISIQNLANGH